jgi:hypothetical protein
MQITVPLAADDLRPLTEFGMRWRWTDPEWNLLDDDALSKIHPLTSVAARRAFETLEVLFDSSGCGLDPTHFVERTQIDTADRTRVSYERSFSEQPRLSAGKCSCCGTRGTSPC